MCTGKISAWKKIKKYILFFYMYVLAITCTSLSIVVCMHVRFDVQ